METENTLTAQKKQPTALSSVPERRLRASALIVAGLGNLALMMGEPIDARGARLRLMAEELSDLPEEAVEHAVRMWRRGDKSHLSEDQRDHIRIGVFFPKPAELREIARYFLRERESLAREIEKAEARLRDEQLSRDEHPEHYTALRCPKCEERLTTFSLSQWTILLNCSEESEESEESKRKRETDLAQNPCPYWLLRCPKCEERLTTFSLKQLRHMRNATDMAERLGSLWNEVKALQERMAQFPAGIYDDETYWQPSDQA